MLFLLFFELPGDSPTRILIGKCPASPALCAGSRGTIKMRFHFREVPACLPLPNGVAVDLQIGFRIARLRDVVNYYEFFFKLNACCKDGTEDLSSLLVIFRVGHN
jgi:hypothetical protein